MNGPTFLLVYTLVTITVIAVAYVTVRAYDTTGAREPPQVPATFDPYEIAYLRGGKYAVTRTVIYALYHRGLVEIITGKWYQSSRLTAKDDGRGGTLAELEERVLRSVDSPITPSKLFENELVNDVERLCEPFRNSLQSEQLLRSGADRNSVLAIPIVASAILVAPPLFRLLNSTHGINFLFFLTWVSLGALWFIAGRFARAYITDRGRAYLKQTQTAYRGVNLSTVAMVGLFGIGILSTTSDAAFAKLFPKGGSGGSGGIESSGCGSGGCGSDGGGCGGD
jgi:uncharacterized protein (TIGR04222 family)